MGAVWISCCLALLVEEEKRFVLSNKARCACCTGSGSAGCEFGAAPEKSLDIAICLLIHLPA